MSDSSVTTAASIDASELEQKVKDMYRDVALDPHGEYHFEMGRKLAERLGYSPEDLDRIPAESIESFAGVGYFFDAANIREGERVIDFGSGSGMDTFVAVLKVGEKGIVVGVDMTDEQLAKSKRLAQEAGVSNLSYLKAYLEDVPCSDDSFDVVISNGVFNLAADKSKVFQEVARVLKKGGRLALSDIVSEQQLPEGITCNTTYWAACIGGAMQIDDYRAAMKAAGLRVVTLVDNPQYQFISADAQGATKKYGVKSVTVVAEKV
ncbi:MAG: hypothetical protein BMS9Abin05_0032 [Rhodothermia bacterium]|nr:MAG: hypothetical protein BMS9Abin05_0032 [Rhodothermia bacterium]